MPDKSASSVTLWSWLFPLTYLIHIGEEFYGGEGYPSYLKRLRGVDMTPTRFLVGQAVGLALIVLGILIARRLNFPRQLLVILGTVVLFNGISHLATSSYYREYGPGLISGVLIWIPFGMATLIRFKDSMSRRRYWLYVAIGVGINVAIALIALKGGKR
ncbi:MAG TPA: HXXEE domain-containing protein [Pyrinomonadaceae bacterium]|nr:HXXEE domain-containing protein [Pyrinomonadaceae bacterium]